MFIFTRIRFHNEVRCSMMVNCVLYPIGKDTVGMGLDTVFGGATIETAQPAEKEANFAGQSWGSS